MSISLRQEECAPPPGLVDVVHVERRLDGEILQELDVRGGARGDVVMVVRVRHGAWVSEVVLLDQLVIRRCEVVVRRCSWWMEVVRRVEAEDVLHAHTRRW
jgi:hypothetical protein